MRFSGKKRQGTGVGWCRSQTNKQPMNEVLHWCLESISSASSVARCVRRSLRRLPMVVAPVLIRTAAVSGGRASALLLRGGGNSTAALPPNFVHAVLLGLVANTVGVMMGNTLSVTSVSTPLHVLQNAAALFFSFLLMYFLTGFVPMGFVPGTVPLLSIFAAR